MAGFDGAVKVVGLRESLAALRAVDATLPREVTRTMGWVVKFRTLTAAYVNLAEQPIPTSRGAIRVAATTKGAGLTMLGGRGSRYPWMFGGEYGSKQYRQFKPWVGNQFSSVGPIKGYIAGAAIEETRDEVVDVLVDEVEKALARKGIRIG